MNIKALYGLLLLVLLSISSSLVFSAERVTIPSGSFQMGCSINDNDCDVDEGPKGGIAVMVKEFMIDKHEVSVSEYRTCVEAGKCTIPKDHNRNKYCNYGDDSRNDHPVNCVDWAEAKSYCDFVDGRLPYEAEWEKAARAGSKMRFPWGQEVSCKNAILDDGKTTGSVPNEGDGCGEDRTWKRGSRAANKFGLYDMYGNAGEWLYNWYSKDAIKQLYAKGDLAGPTEGRRKLVHGGSWDENRVNLRSSFRNVKNPVSGEGIYGSLGFRCAYDK